MTTLLNTLRIHHKKARSLNFLGTALEVVAGTPDFDDFQSTKFRQEQLIEANNRQVEINTKIISQLQNLTATINGIVDVTNKINVDTEKLYLYIIILYETLLARNRIAVISIENRILSVGLAKTNIIDLAILDNEEIESKIKNGNFAGTSVSEMMIMSSIKIYQNNEL